MSQSTDRDWVPCPPGALQRAASAFPAQLRERGMRPIFGVLACWIMVAAMIGGWWILQERKKEEWGEPILREARLDRENRATLWTFPQGR